MHSPQSTAADYGQHLQGAYPLSPNFEQSSTYTIDGIYFKIQWRADSQRGLEFEPRLIKARYTFKCISFLSDLFLEVIWAGFFEEGIKTYLW